MNVFFKHSYAILTELARKRYGAKVSFRPCRERHVRYCIPLLIPNNHIREILLKGYDSGSYILPRYLRWRIHRTLGDLERNVTMLKERVKLLRISQFVDQTVLEDGDDMTTAIIEVDLEPCIGEDAQVFEEAP